MGDRDIIIYLSGGMQGKPLEEVRATFQKYEDKYKARGWGVYNPFNLDGGEHGTVDDAGILTPSEPEWNKFIARDLGLIIQARPASLYMIPGWTASRGARLEVLVAAYLGIPIINAETDKIIDNAKKKAKDAHGKV